MWTWLIVALIVALAAGPILTLRPTRRQRESARLRTYAATLGLRVRLAEIPGAQAKHSGESFPVYILAWLHADDVNLGKQPPWQLVRVKFSHEIHAYSDWDWVSKNYKPAEHWQQALKALFDQAQGDPLFDRLEGIEWSGQGVQIYWRETAEKSDVDRLLILLQELKAHGLDASHQPQWPP